MYLCSIDDPVVIFVNPALLLCSLPLYEKFKLRTLFWIQGSWRWVLKWCACIPFCFHIRRNFLLLTSYLVAGEKMGIHCRCLKKNWRLLPRAKTLRSTETTQNKFTVLFKETRILHALLAFHALHVRFVISSLFQSISANERGEMIQLTDFYFPLLSVKLIPFSWTVIAQIVAQKIF